MRKRTEAWTPDSDRWQTFVRRRANEMGLDIGPDQAALLAAHALELERWNRKINLTAITDPMEAAVKHFLDSLAPAAYIPPGSTLLDIGSGGGFPGIPLKIAVPSLTVTLVEATLKKVHFMQQVIRLLRLEKIQAIHGRAESLNDDAAFQHSFDTVICRAFTSLKRFVSISHRLVTENGKLLAMKGDNVEPELRELEKLTLSVGSQRLNAAGLFSVAVHPYRLHPSGDRRHLVILRRR